ncbi:hypothetical protein PUN28_005786 [Cardiocondyla obscurior]|uniref:Uncharacterized protein n=1 Tax=Cardiocondyla obscurior TaxID=286306 RepID=A0AAW2G7Z4_9HYME
MHILHICMYTYTYIAYIRTPRARADAYVRIYATSMAGLSVHVFMCCFYFLFSYIPFCRILRHLNENISNKMCNRCASRCIRGFGYFICVIYKVD